MVATGPLGDPHRGRWEDAKAQDGRRDKVPKLDARLKLSSIGPSQAFLGRSFPSGTSLGMPCCLVPVQNLAA
jgi:hypothetical protein